MGLLCTEKKSARIALMSLIKTKYQQTNICLALTSELAVLSVSDDIEALLGFTADDFLTEKITFQSFIHVHDQDIAQYLFSKEINPASGTFNIRLRHADGRIRCIKGQYTKTIDVAGKGIVLELLLQDAKSLWQQQGDQTMMVNFEAMMNNSDDYIYFKDSNHVFTGASETLVAITDPSEHWKDLIGKTDYDVFPEAFADVYYSLEKKVFSGMQVAHEVQETLDNDGNKGWVDNRKYPIKNDNGEIIGLFGIARDITKNILFESELKIAAIAFESKDGILVTDVNGTILRVNQSFTEITGYSAFEAIGNNPRLLKSTYHDTDFYVALWQRIANTGFYKGEVWNRRKNGQIYPEELTITAVKNNAGNITNYVATFRDISVRKATETRVSFLANYDRLTELPNRELYYDRLSQSISMARRKNEIIAVLFLDLDGFKPINDTYGHEAGDVVLKVVAKRLQASVRNIDTVARMGGDEFSIILNALQHPIDAEFIAQKIIHNIAEVIELNATTTCAIGISIGIAIYPENGSELDVLMNAADAVMYESKVAGKNTYTVSKLRNHQLASNDPWIRPDEIPLLGVPIIDEQHVKIVSIINEINDALKHRAQMEQLIQLLEDLISFTDYHFKTEERLMDEFNYLEDIEHKNGHEHLLNELSYLKTRFVQGGELVLLQKIKDWFAIHINCADKPLADFIIQQKTMLLNKP